MTEQPESIKTYIINRYGNSSYANFLRMSILELHEGDITVSMPVSRELTNLRRILHGGAVGSLLDMAMNLACFSLGNRVSILGFNVNFLSACGEGKIVRALARVLHSGKSTMVVEAGVLDPEDKLLSKGRGTFWVTGQFTREDLRGEAATEAVGTETPPDEGKKRILPNGTKNQIGRLGDFLLRNHDRNYFAKYLGMEIREFGERYCIVAMPVTHTHVNIRGVVHGGALVSLADMSLMLACATVGKRTVTLDLNINFVRRAVEGAVVACFSQVIHNGKTTMVVRSSVFDEEEKLLAEARGTFFVMGDYTPEEYGKP